MKKYISLILCALLLVGLVFPAYAVSTDNTEPSEPSVPVETGGSEETAVSEETTVPSDPTETTASTNPTETTASTDPTETTAPTDPTETTAATDPTETTAATDPTETTAATDPTETTAATEPTDPVCTCPGTEEEKAAEGFVHQEGCPYYVEKVEETDPYAELLGKMLTAQSTSEIQVLLAPLPEEEQEAFVQWLNENGQMETLQAHLVALIELEYEPPVTKSFTSAGPFMPPVTVASSGVAKMARMLFAMPADDGSDSEDNGLYTFKKAVDNQNGTYTITLEAYTSGTVTNTETSIPVDIVLVLDQSGSMADSFSASGGGKKQAALKSAVTNFISSVAEKYSDTADHRISIVTFESVADTLQEWTYVDDRGKTSLTNSIKDLPDRPSGATRVDSGMNTASGLIKNPGYTGPNAKRQQVVIVFTDGVPTESSAFNLGVADSAIKTALDLKGEGVTVYTVGIFNGANKDQLHGDTFHSLGFLTINQEPCNGNVGETFNTSLSTSWFGDVKENDVPAGNRFLNFLSSNFPTASHIGLEEDNDTILGVGFFGYKITENFPRTNSGYYLTAADQSDLESIFQTISDQISTPSINLGSETVIKDVVTPYFEMPQNASEVKVYTADYDGRTFNERVESDLTAYIDGDTVSVTGFNFDDNFVSDTARGDNFYGRKLIVEFTVKPKDGFLGGNQVPTNVNTSGVYTGETLVEAFTEPHVDVPIPNITVTASDKNVYLLAGLDSDALVEGAVVKAGDVTIDFSESEENYGLDTWQNAFVDISSTGTGPEGAQLSNLREDTSYTLTVTVAPKYAGTELETTGSDSGQIYVFKPEITWKDSEKNIGDIPDYEKDNFDSLKWIHATEKYDVDKMIGEVPSLTYAYDPVAAKLTKETPVKVTVKIGETVVNEFTKFVHKECTIEGCKWDEYKEDYHFLVHVKSFDLTITKSGCDTTLDPHQTFVFTVTGPNSFSMEVVIKGNGSTTIKNLPAGDYTVTEDTGWSWRYNPSNNGLTGSPENPEVTFRNTRNNDYWLDGNAYCENKFGAYTSSTGE